MGDLQVKICVCGLWHLGLVTAASLSELGNKVYGFDENENTISDLKKNISPIFEPGLNDLIKKKSSDGSLVFTNELNSVSNEVNIFWVCCDTPVNDKDEADVDSVKNFCKNIVNTINRNITLIISSQLPIGTYSSLKKELKMMKPDLKIEIVIIPENLRLGKALEVFLNPDRIVIGLENSILKDKLIKIYGEISEKIIWMSPQSAEMTKHAINSFLATSIVFANELSYVSKEFGANPKEVEIGIKSDERIGFKSYLSAGGAFAGGTLARDVKFLQSLGKDIHFNFPLINSILDSNSEHKDWIKFMVNKIIPNEGVKAVIWGMAYKKNTSTLRRSYSVEIMRWLKERGADIEIHDPLVDDFSDAVFDGIKVLHNPLDFDPDNNLLIIGTPNDFYSNISVSEILKVNPKIKIIDQSSVLKLDRIDFKELYNI